MASDGTKIVSLKRANWITWRDLMLSLLKSQDLHEYLYEDKNVPEQEHKNEAKATFLIKKNISPEVYYLVRNLTRPHDIWCALRGYYGSTSKRNIQTCKRALREITIESCSFDIPTYLQCKADAIDALIDLDVNIDDNEMSDQILEGLERDFRLTDFLFFQSTQDNSDYHRHIADIQVYVNTKSFKMKYGLKGKSHKANLTTKTAKKKKNSFFCDFCKKSGHTTDYCYSNPKSKKYKGHKEGKKSNVQLHTTNIANPSVQKLRNFIVLDSGATDHFFSDKTLFVDDIQEYSSSLECASGTIPITGIGTVKFETDYSVISVKNALYVPKLGVNLLSLTKLETKGVRYAFEEGDRMLKLGKSVISSINKSSNLLTLNVKKNWCALSYESDEKLEKCSKDLHSALGHLSYDKIKHLKLQTDVKLKYPCDICNATKTTRDVPSRKFQKPHRHLYELIHTDICEMPVKSVEGFKYYALFIDDASRFSYIVLLRKKSDIYRGFSDMIENGSNNISTLRSE